MLGLPFKLRQLVLKKDGIPTIFNFPMESYKPAQKNNEKQAYNASRTAIELLCHFPGKKRFVLKPKTFPNSEALTQGRSNVQDHNDITKQSLSSIPSS